MIKILLVEHHEIVRAGIRKLLLRDETLKVVGVAASAEEAIGLLNGGLDVNVVITNLELGKHSGIEFTQLLTALYPHLSTMVITNDNSERQLMRALHVGAKGYLLIDNAIDELIYGLLSIAQHKHFICSALTGSLCKTLSVRRNCRELSTDNIDLTAGNLEVLNLIATGFTNQEIGNRLFASKRTI